MNRLTLILLLPLAGFLVNGLLGRRLPRPLVAAVACSLPAVAFALTVSLAVAQAGGAAPLLETLFAWAALPGLSVEVAFAFDRVTAVMCLLVTGVGTLVHLYSVGYMADDDGFARYFAYLNLFLFFMLLLVLGNNLPLLFAGWEGVGFVSYLLIGFWFEDHEKTAASLKAFVVNRVGDAGFVLAMLLIFLVAGTFDFAGINAFFAATPPAAAVTTAIALLLLVGACGKSAQIPLHVWLPDAMAGPTPVSALIHAATMVTAGVYLLVRLNPLFLAAPDAMAVVAWGGALTALVGASMGLVQSNLKKVLAYSTMSQLGYMFLACGLGAFDAAMFHLTTHAFFKACLFLGAGVVIHALHGEEDMRRMGGLARRLPFTCAVFVAGSLALCGVPPFAGFFSKDEILWNAWAAPGGSPLLWGVGALTALLTAFYMARAIFLTFFGATRVAPRVREKIHEPPPSMASVLLLLAACSLVAGFAGLPPLWQEWQEWLGIGAPFHEFLAPVVGHSPALPDHHLELTLMAVSVVLALSGIAGAWLLCHRRADWGERLRQRCGRLGELVRRGYCFDPLFYGVVRLADRFSESVLARRVEGPLSGTVLNRPGDGVRFAARLCARLQGGNVQGYLLYALAGLALILCWGVAYA